MENVKKVAVLIGKGYTEDRVRKEIKEEGYTFAFYFGSYHEMIIEADEVWTFGDCSDLNEYKFAVARGCELWDMTV